MSHHTSADILFIPEGFRVDYRQHRHGGMRREAQVHELLNGTGLTVSLVTDRVLADPPSLGSFSISQFLEGTRVERNLTGQWPITRARQRNARGFGRHIHYYRHFFDQHPSARVVVTENLRNHNRLVSVARERGLGVICVPHDISSLSDGRCRHNATIHALRTFHNEVAVFGQANSVFAISREQQWLLKGFGISSEFLPYYPIEADLAPLRHIRERRSVRGETILIVGTAIHEPTRLGMVELLSWLGRAADRPGFGRIVVAGFGTEALAEQGKAAGAEVLGAVSESQMTELLIEAKAVLAHQQFGCGALTRITELLVAGVPVIVSPIAARSYHGTDGVYVFDTVNEMYDLIRRELPMPKMPLRPANAEETFRRAVRELSRGGRPE